MAEALVDLIFPAFSRIRVSDGIRIVSFGTDRRDDDPCCTIPSTVFVILLAMGFMIWFSLSVVEVDELTVDVLECRLERIVGRQFKKLGLFECGVADNEAEEDEY